MKKIKFYISIIALIVILAIIFIYPQYLEQAIKSFVVIMECEQCLFE